MSLKEILESNNGANFYKADLHLHSPADASFSTKQLIDTAQKKKEFAKTYCEALRKAEIRIAAITDHNQIGQEWFSLIQEEAGKSGITVFPGVELSINEGKRAIHIIVIFDVSENLVKINDAITAIFGGKARFDEQGMPALSETGLEGAISRLKENHKCICIAAHPSNDKGLFKELSQPKIAELLKKIDLSAFENLNKDTVNGFIISQKDKLRGVRIPPVIYSSDSKKIEDINPVRNKISNGVKSDQPNASRFTFIKISDFSLEGLRQALIDPESRIRLPRELKKESYTKIIGFESIGANFLSGIRIHFNDNLQCLIGGRGTGKSAILESIRYTLGFEPLYEQDSRFRLIRHSLGSGGKGVVYIKHKFDKLYKVERILEEEPRVYEFAGELSGENVLKEDWKEIKISPQYIFAPDPAPEMFGQKEIYAVSQTDEYQLNLIDGIIGKDLDGIRQEKKELIDNLRTNARAILDINKDLIKKEDYEKELERISQELKLYKEQGVAEKLEREARLNRERQNLHSIGDKLQKTYEQCTLFTTDITDILESILKISTGEISPEIFDELKTDVLKTKGDLSLLSNQIIEKVRDLLKLQKEKLLQWEKKYKEFQDELAQTKQALRTDKLDPDRFLHLDKKKNSLTPLINELRKAEKKLINLRADRENLIKGLDDLHYKEHLKREEKIEEINGKLEDVLKIEVLYKGFKTTFNEYLVTAFKGSKIRTENFKDIITKGDAITFAKTVREGKEALKQKYDLTDTTASQIVEWLKEEKLMEMEAFIIPDRIEIKLKLGDDYKSFSDLSLGQKCTSLLLILLLEKDIPLIVDQPEDDLDNRFIYEDVIKILRKEKFRRQFIVATHNANIPVLGDAELVTVLETHKDKCRIKDMGSIDNKDVSDSIKEILEGGKEAFMRRKEKYGF